MNRRYDAVLVFQGGDGEWLALAHELIVARVADVLVVPNGLRRSDVAMVASALDGCRVITGDRQL